MVRLTVLAIICFSVLCLANGAKNKGCKKPKKIRPVFIKEYSCACDDKLTGQLRYDDGKILLCNGSEWKALQFEVQPGSKLYPGSSCEDIKAKDPGQTTNGVYWITSRDSRGALLPVYCDMAAGGWTMVFKTVNGEEIDAFDAFNSANTYAEMEMDALDVTNTFSDIYKNEIVENWGYFGPSEVRVVLYKGGSSVKELTFNAQGTDKLNWFASDRLTNTPWSDIKTESKNHFSIAGDSPLRRRFFINSAYGGCPGDIGWMVIGGTACDWEKNNSDNAIMYSTIHTRTNWNNGDNVGVADVLAVFVR